MDRYVFHPAVGVGAGALFAGHVAVYVLPASLIGLPTPVVLLAAGVGAILWAVRYL